MREISLFAEDLAHEVVIKALLSRFARAYGVEVHIRAYSVRGGRSKAIRELEQYLRDLRNSAGLPDMLIVATDANCKGYVYRRNEIRVVTDKY